MYLRKINIDSYYDSLKKNALASNDRNFYKHEIENLYDSILNENASIDEILPYAINAVSLDLICMMRAECIIDGDELDYAWRTFQAYADLTVEINNTDNVIKQNELKEELKPIVSILKNYGLPISEDIVRKELEERKTASKSYK